LNEKVEPDGFELPKISEIISVLRDQKYFTRLDLKDGFFQIPIRKEDKEKTAFFTGKKLMQFTRMPQGFRNSPAIFQRAMTLVLKDLIGKICLVYIDDVLIFGKDLDEHDRNMCLVTERLKKYGLEENENKRTFRVTSICFLGYN
jgi:hypothetical protein